MFSDSLPGHTRKKQGWTWTQGANLHPSISPILPAHGSHKHLSDTLFELSSNCVHLGGKKNKVLANEHERNHSSPSARRSISLRQPTGWVLKDRKDMGKVRWFLAPERGTPGAL